MVHRQILKGRRGEEDEDDRNCPSLLGFLMHKGLGCAWLVRRLFSIDSLGTPLRGFIIP
ncbi:hypothetical protein SLEP1_g45957 [Rubroshorea leprosula]|uniref:Uncharacterized protein n=1 Tax=Rubroshorea leprosula TaxID=152421 RepID=A0AAV5LKT2_9ROSI|nr:hypothetical protein SLEP1_g45957 [Rubroshorea leprosula]